MRQLRGWADGHVPEVVYFIEPENYIVTRFIIRKSDPPDVIKQPDYLARVVKIRLFHNMDQRKGELTFSTVEMLRKFPENNAKFPLID
jgi:hypothetical protein